PLHRTSAHSHVTTYVNAVNTNMTAGTRYDKNKSQNLEADCPEYQFCQPRRPRTPFLGSTRNPKAPVRYATGLRTSDQASGARAVSSHQKPLVNLGNTLHAPPHAKLARLAQSKVAKIPTKRPISYHLRKVLRHLCIPEWISHNQCSLTNDFFHGAAGGGNRWTPALHRLQGRKAKSLVNRRKYKSIGRIVKKH